MGCIGMHPEIRAKKKGEPKPSLGGLLHDFDRDCRANSELLTARSVQSPPVILDLVTLFAVTIFAPFGYSDGLSLKGYLRRLRLLSTLTGESLSQFSFADIACHEGHEVRHLLCLVRHIVLRMCDYAPVIGQNTETEVISAEMMIPENPIWTLAED